MSNSPFTKSEENVIVELFIQYKSPTAVKRQFCQKYANVHKTRWLYGLQPHQFSRVYQKFQKNGIGKTENPSQNWGREYIDKGKVKLIETL